MNAPAFRTVLAVFLTVLMVGASGAVGATMVGQQDATENSVNATTLSGHQHTLGGTTTEGALRIDITRGQIDVDRYTNGNWQRQYYTDSGALLYVDGTTYDFGYYDGDNDATFVSQSRSGSTVTTEWTAGDFRVIQEIRYSPSDAQYFRLDWTITNEGGSSASDVRFFRGEDTYLAGGDYGYGFWDASTNTIGVNKTVGGAEVRLAFQGITDPAGYESRNYYSVYQSVNNGDLTNSVNPNFHDNGYALEWRRSSIGAGNSWNIAAIERFTDSSIIVDGPGTVQSSGGSVDLNFDVRNIGEEAETVSFDSDCPSGWTCSTPGNVNINAGSSSQVTVTATPPNSVSDGTYQVSLTATGSQSGSVAQGVAQVEVSVPEATAPEASNDRYTTFRDEILRVSAPGVLSNDDDPDGGSLSVSTTPVTAPSNGQLTLRADGSFRYTPDSGFTGRDSFTYRVRDDEGETDTASARIRVRAPPPNFEATIDATNSPVAPGDTLRVDATITNTGGQSDTQTIALSIDGNIEDTEEVSLSPGNSEQITLRWETTSRDTGNHTARVASNIPGNFVDDSTEVVVADEQTTPTPPAFFDVTLVESNSPVLEGENLTVNASVENNGGQAGTQEVVLSINGTELDNATVDLDAGENRTVPLVWVTAAGDAGNYTANVSSADDTANATVQVRTEPLPAAFDVNVTGTNTPVTAGETLTVTATVENVGGLNGTGNVTLSMNGVEVDRTSVTLDSGANQSVTLTWQTTPADVGDYTATAETDTASDSEFVTVEPRSLAQYNGPSGRVTTTGLENAFADWSQGRLTTEELIRIIDAWASGTGLN